MGWLLYDTVGTNYYPITNEKLVRQISGLNYVTCKLEDVILASNTLVNVLDESGTVVFTGFIKKTADPTDDINRYEITERASEIADDLCDTGSYVYNFSIVTSSVNTILDNTVLNGTGWTRGSSDTTLMTQMSFYYETQFDALFRVLVDYRDHFVWFNNTTKYVYFGSSRTDRTADDVVYISKNAEVDSNNRVYDKIIVIGANDSITAVQGTNGGTVKCYQMPELKSSYEALQVCMKLFNDMGTYNKGRVTCLLEPTSLYDEGDLVSIDGSNYIVYNVEMSSVGTKLVCDSRTTNINDVFVEEKYKPTYDSVVGASGVTDHGSLSGLGDDDHTQYLPISGIRAMSGDLNIGNNEIDDCNRINLEAGVHPMGYIKTVFTDPTYELDIWGESEIRFFNGSLGSEAESVSFTVEHLDMHSHPIVSLGAHTANGNAVRYEHLAADEHTQYYNSARHTKAIHDALNIDADTLDGLDSLDFVKKDGSVAMSGALPMGTNKITGLGTPSVDTDAATKKYVDDNAGGAGDFLADGSVPMTGDIDIGNNEIDNCNKINMDAGFHPAAYINPVFTDPTYDLKIWGESEIMFFNGSLGSESESVSITTEHLDLHSNKIVSVGTPTADTDVATKGYVDALPGVDGVSFILDQDNAGAGVSSSLRFNRGSTDGDAAIWWDEGDDEFQFESDVGVTVGSILIDECRHGGSVKTSRNPSTGDYEIEVASGDSIVFKAV